MPTYVRKCEKCGNRFDVVVPVVSRNLPVPCEACGAKTERVIAVRTSFTPFRAGLFPVGENGEEVYVGDRKQLKEACDRNGLISHYLEGSPTTFKQNDPKPISWTEGQEKKLVELYDAVDGKGMEANEAATKWLEDYKDE